MTEVSPALRRILKADCCTGCGACASVSGGAITMAMTPAGQARGCHARSSRRHT